MVKSVRNKMNKVQTISEALYPENSGGILAASNSTFHSREKWTDHSINLQKILKDATAKRRQESTTWAFELHWRTPTPLKAMTSQRKAWSLSQKNRNCKNKPITNKYQRPLLLRQSTTMKGISQAMNNKPEQGCPPARNYDLLIKKKIASR